MFYFLSKTVAILAMPFSITIILLLYAVAAKNKTRKRNALITAFVILFLISNSFLINRAFGWWEYEYKNLNDVDQVYDVGVVLSGGLMSSFGEGSDHPELGRHADRFFQAYELYKAGKIKKILITGRDFSSAMRYGKGESRQAAQTLVKWGIPAENILFEERARNTRENAVNSARIINARFPGAKVIVITSSFHMRRSAGCFAKVGMVVNTFPANFYGTSQNTSLKDILVPDTGTIGEFDLLWHEWLGYAAYKIMGYC